MSYRETFTDPRSQSGNTVIYAIFEAKFPTDTEKWMEGSYFLFADREDGLHLYRRDAFKNFAAAYTIYGEQELTKQTSPPSKDASLRSNPSPDKTRDAEIQALKQQVADLIAALQQK